MDKMTCDYCGKEFLRDKGNYERNRWGASYCNLICLGKAKSNVVSKACAWCDKPVIRCLSYCKKSKTGNAFCNRSCAAHYNNKTRKKSRRSKSEISLFELLCAEFQDLKIIPTDKEMLDGYEVDIAIPSLQIAIEWNGIVHFEPIYGQAKLDNVQQRDAEKHKLAKEKQITLITVADIGQNKNRVNEAFGQIAEFIRRRLN